MDGGGGLSVAVWVDEVRDIVSKGNLYDLESATVILGNCIAANELLTGL